jgi:hypothetical protein
MNDLLFHRRYSDFHQNIYYIVKLTIQIELFNPGENLNKIIFSQKNENNTVHFAWIRVVQFLKFSQNSTAYVVSEKSSRIFLKIR